MKMTMMIIKSRRKNFFAPDFAEADLSENVVM
jgi:hypothetical protein